MAKKRERLEVIKDILESVRDSRNIKPTRLLYSSNLSPQMFKDYVDELLNKGFIKLDVDNEGKKSEINSGKIYIHYSKNKYFFSEQYIFDNIYKIHTYSLKYR